MAKKSASKPATSTPPLSRGFLNINLTDEDKAIIKSTAYDTAEWSSDIDKWIDNGFKFNFSYDDYSHCFQVIGMRSDKEHRDYGILLTGRGSTAIKAFRQWLYIQTRLVGELYWSEILETKKPQEIDD